MNVNILFLLNILQSQTFKDKQERFLEQAPCAKKPRNNVFMVVKK